MNIEAPGTRIAPLLLQHKEVLGNIIEQANGFDSISLTEMDGVKLMNRVDVKYYLPLNQLPGVLAELKSHYRLLEIAQQRLCPYETLYFDTPDLSLYHQHQAGRLNRYKVRLRNYVNSNLAFFEVKFKNNKGRTIKTRIRRKDELTEPIDQKSADFLTNTTPLMPTSLQPVMWVDYQRLTLVGKNQPERLTIDVNLVFRDSHGVGVSAQACSHMMQLVIIEVKQEKLGASAFHQIARKHQLHQGGMSKYCLGMIKLHNQLKHNRFKSKLHKLMEICQ